MERIALFAVACLVVLPACLARGLNLSQALLGHWDNDFDRPLNFQCRSDEEAVSGIKSYHDNHREDRRFEVFCRRVMRTSRPKQCYWTNYVNTWDALIHFSCKDNYYINGMHSVHHNHYEDRIWKFRCCEICGVPLTNCQLSGWTNHWDGWQHYTAPTGHVFKGVVSVHDNHREDRLYEYMICKPGTPKCCKPKTWLESRDIGLESRDTELESRAIELPEEAGPGVELMEQESRTVEEMSE